MTDSFKYWSALEITMKGLMLVIIAIILLMPQVMAIGVARPFYQDDTLAVSVNQEIGIPFQIQNGENTQKTILFTVEIDAPASIKFQNGNYGTKIEQQYLLPSKKVENVLIFFKANQSGTYRFSYTYAESSAGSGAVKFDTKITDSFFVKVGTGGTSSLGIQTEYFNYRLITEATNIRFIDDLVIKSITSGWPQIDFSGTELDLTGFLEKYVSIQSNKKVVINSTGFPALNKSAKITFYNIGQYFKIMKDGVECFIPTCRVVTHSTSRLVIAVPGFSSYEVVELPAPPKTNTTTGTGSTGSSGGNTGGTTGSTTGTTQINTTKNPLDDIKEEEKENYFPEPPKTGGQAVNNSVNSPPSSNNNSLINKIDEQIKQDGIDLTGGKREKNKVVVLVLTMLGFAGLVVALVLNGRGMEEEEVLQ